MTKSLKKALDEFSDNNERLAKKYKCQISISVSTGLGKESKEVVLADHREKKK